MSDPTVSLDCARQLLDFRGRISDAAAEEQLRGAVAIHNLLAKQRVAYLADEVGMGKTYVALGAFALFRHFNPEFRMLVIAPRENIQQKWIRELKTFVKSRVTYPDLRVKAIHGAPARPPVFCRNLYELARETMLDPDRDFFTRMTSFSMGIGGGEETGRRKRDELLKLLPSLDRHLLDLRSHDSFRRNYARAINRAIPPFDLVIVDEAHVLKHGRASKSQRNELLRLVMGLDEETDPRDFPGYGRRARRVLFLSATPLEDDYRQLWNQLDLFGFGSLAPELADRNATSEAQKRATAEFLVRRVTSIQTGGNRYTKNLYRRSWEQGGVETHDDPLGVPDDRQRLVVALMQKKVNELIGSEKFNNSFQIGMLASFESFFQTASRALESGAESTFDDAEQTENPEERAGIDVGIVNRMAASYRRKFGEELPHPKMDALVDELAGSFDTGRKALVFVRRTASVSELERKLEERYDSWLFERLMDELDKELRERIGHVFENYREQRRHDRLTSPAEIPLELENELPPAEGKEVDRGGHDTFFAWFFRGGGPGEVFSGATLSRRLSQAGGFYSTFFEDNYVARLLGVSPGNVMQALTREVGLNPEDLEPSLGRFAARRLPSVKKQSRSNLFHAFQAAALELLAHSDELRDDAATILLEQYSTGRDLEGTKEVPSLGSWLETRTFFTELRERTALRQDLWPEEKRDTFVKTFRREELRRELLASMVRLGHPLIDLYVLVANRLRNLELGTREASSEDDEESLIVEFLDLLERQKGEGRFRAYQELAEAAANFDLILDVNLPDAWEAALQKAGTEFGRLLREQQPIGGMFGSVNQTMVRQFRLPGYPFVLISTDLLQEGEDLHPFCSSVYHYGISWMPSSMEQRIGRIDRVSSQTERRLTVLDRKPEGEELLQVYFPHLLDSVERLQVNRVLERMESFIELMHQSLASNEERDERQINIAREIHRAPRTRRLQSEPLESAFPVRDDFVRGTRKKPAVDERMAGLLRERFAKLQESSSGMEIRWEPGGGTNAMVGVFPLGDRQQPFTLLLHSIHGRPNVRCVSPIGMVDRREEALTITEHAARSPVRIGAVFDNRFRKYDLTAEGDVLLGDPASDAERVRWLIASVARAADELEHVLLDRDETLETFREDLGREAFVER
ncbi:MAG: DEAD/DEAH box helicase family protein [Acidobacteria bacterium]|nr:DEAD/DEAH box helicase family protein [Acidobacteriota bacterium]